MAEDTRAFTRREAALFVAVALAAPGAALAQAEATLKLRLLAVSDLHSYLESYDYYHDEPEDTVGLVRIATLIKAARREAPNCLLFDNGDLLQGNPLADLFAREKAGDGIHPVIEAMNALDYDAATPGNHDFNYGLGFLMTAIKGARFPYILGNVDRVGGGSLLPPYVILERGFLDGDGKVRKLKVGILGLVTPQITIWDKPNLDGKVTAADIVERARAHVPQIRAKGADLVIALAHTGFDTRPARGLDENTVNYLTEVPGLDAVISGHQHRVYPDPSYASMPEADIAKGTLHRRPTVMPGFYGSHLGVIDLDLARIGGVWQVATAAAEVRPIYRREGGKTVTLVESDPDIAAAVVDAHRQTLAYIRRPIGRIAQPINTFFSVVEPDTSIALINMIQRLAVEKGLKGGPYAELPVLSAAAPLRAGGIPGPDSYTDVPAGEIAIKNVGDLYIYPNTLQAVRVTGVGLREWLEMSAILYRRIDPMATEPQMLIQQTIPAFTFDTISGITYRIDLTQPAKYDRKGNLVAPTARRIRDLSFRGKPVADDAVFVVATNNYRAAGGGFFPGLDGKSVIFDSPDVMQTVIADYFRTQKQITPATEMNWRFMPIATPVDVRFESSPKAKAHLSGDGRITWIGPGNNGFDLYRLNLSQG